MADASGVLGFEIGEADDAASRHDQGRESMSYSTKMQLRMLLPCLMPLLFGTLASWVLNAIDSLSGGLGGQTVESQMPEYIFLTGVVVTTLALAYQCFRLWRWSRGEGDACYVCGCLLGDEKRGRWGNYRPCLGCLKNHALH